MSRRRIRSSLSWCIQLALSSLDATSFTKAGNGSRRLALRPTSVHFKALVIKEAEIIASRVTLGEFPRAIRLLERGLLHPDLLITDELPMRDVATAFARLDREAPETVKMVLDVQAA